MNDTIINFRSEIIVYIVPYIHNRSNAIATNISRRKKLLEALGYTVLLIEHEFTSFTKISQLLWRKREQIKAVIIRIDGSSKLEKFTLLKLAMPRIPFLWEIHGFAEEQLSLSTTLSTRLTVLKNNYKRTILSYLVRSCLFISQELYLFAATKIYIRHMAIIPNFIDTSLKKVPVTSDHILSIFKKNKYKIILWGGSGELPWQAVDVVQKVAHAMYKINKHSIFLLVGSGYWTKTQQRKNILFLDPVDHTEFMKLISLSDVCLALYNDPLKFPFYFCPMKILDYMSAGKPVIATNIGSIPTIIQNGQNGFLTGNSLSDIEKKIRVLLTNTSVSKKISQNAKKSVETMFSCDIAMKQYTAVFTKIGI